MPSRSRFAAGIPFTLMLCLFVSAAVADNGLAPIRARSAAELARLAAKAPPTQAARWYDQMSSMGAIAAGVAPRRDAEDSSPIGFLRGSSLGTSLIGGGDIIVHGPGDYGTQGETAIAANPGGTILIAGYNDARGFSTTPNSLSGIARSLDGGLTWNELPVGPGGAGTLPCPVGGTVFGDPDVRWDAVHNRFVYSSIYARPSDGLQGLCVHTSDANGGTWNGPFEVAPTFINAQSADKPFMDVNPNTGRIILTWTQFSTVVRIMSTFSDDGGTTWSPAVTLFTGSASVGVQASVPRFLPGATNASSSVYVVWRVSGATTRNVAMCRSVDGGATFSVPVNLTTDFAPEDQILGVDRVNTSPSMAIDYTSGRVYVTYQANNSTGEGDVAFQTLVGIPVAVPRILIDSHPGLDRAQFYPAVAVDQSTHRVHVIWNDQDDENTGDLTELMHAYSNNAGVTWSRPTPLYDRPFRAGYGNDTGQPNLGDYMEAVAQGGVLHTLATGTSLISQFDEGQPTQNTLFSPDVYYDQLSDAAAIASLRLGTVSMSEACPAGVNGWLDPGESADFTFPLENYVSNPNDSPITYTGVSATLSSSTPGVSVLTPTQSYGSIAPLAVISSGAPFRIKLSGAMVPGTYVNLLLTVNTDQGSIQLPYLLSTGTPTFTTLMSQDFESATVPNLPAGWTFTNGGGSATPPWVTATTIPGGGVGTKMAFHTNTTTTKWHRLFSPIVTVPTPASGTQTFVTLDFDVAYDTEIEPTLALQAYDGLTLRITDQTSGQTLRSVLAEAFAEVLMTGTSKHFPRHLPRNSSTSYFEDMSVWAGYSGGFVHVSMRFPGAGIVGRSIQLRFEYTDDGSADCTANGSPPPCGVGIDNIVLRQAMQGTSFTPISTTTSVTSDVNPVIHLQPVTFTANMAPGTVSGTVEFFDGASSLGTAPVVSGSAQLTNSTLSTGVHSITAVYSGDPCDGTSTSAPYSQTVNTEVGVGDGTPVTELALTGIVPNPASGVTNIGFALPRDSHVTLGIYDVGGRLVRRLVDHRFQAGRHTVLWDVRAPGDAAGPGIYFVRLEAQGITRQGRFAVVK